MTSDNFKKVNQIYTSLVAEKNDKLNLMRKIKSYMKPNDMDLIYRFRKAPNDSFLKNNLYDNTCLNLTSHFSISSLSDIINPYEAWFSLNVKRGPQVDSNKLMDWSKKATYQLLRFINDSDYYKYLITDKRNYDLYGFSALTIGKGSRKPLRIFSENPFGLLIYEDDEGVQGYMFTRQFSSYSMKELFDWEEEDKQEGTEQMYDVLFCFLPNTPDFVDENPKQPTSDKPYVATQYLKNSYYKSTNDRRNEVNDFGLNDSGFREEIGTRRFLNMLPASVVRDSFESYHAYGEGWGKKMLTIAMNMNIIRRNMLKGSEFAGNPAFVIPGGLNTRYRKILPGRTYFPPFPGQKSQIESIPIDSRLNEQGAFLGLEQQQAQDTMPSLSPPQKKQRQSQEEIQKLLMEASKNNFIYKIIYLTDGVTEHLRRIFRIAVDEGVIEDFPDGLSYEDVEPSLSSLISGELKKSKAMAHSQVLGMLQGWLSFYSEGFDNFDIDAIIRGTSMALCGGDGLEDMTKVEQIRETRKTMIEQQQQQQQAVAQAQNQLLSAQAQAQGAMAVKTRKEAEVLGGELPS